MKKTIMLCILFFSLSQGYSQKLVMQKESYVNLTESVYLTCLRLHFELHSSDSSLNEYFESDTLYLEPFFLAIDEIESTIGRVCVYVNLPKLLRMHQNQQFPIYAVEILPILLREDHLTIKINDVLYRQSNRFKEGFSGTLVGYSEVNVSFDCTHNRFRIDGVKYYYY